MLPCRSGSRMRHRPKWDKANFDAIYPPALPHSHPRRRRAGRHATAKSGGGSFPIIPMYVCVSGHFKVCGKGSEGPPSVPPLSDAWCLCGRRRGAEGNEYLEKFMAIRNDDLGLTPPTPGVTGCWIPRKSPSCCPFSIETLE